MDMQHCHMKIALMSSLLAVSCAHTSADTAPPAPIVEGPQATTDAAADAELFGALDTLHAQAIAHSEQIRKRARREQLRGYATMLNSEHQRLRHRERELRTALDLPVTTGPVAADIARESQIRLDVISDMHEGEALDRTFAAVQVSVHGAWLAVLDGQLLPRARTSELKEELAETRALLVDYQQRAIAMRDEVDGAKR